VDQVENYVRKPNTVCGVCGAPCYKRPSVLKNLKNGTVFCGRECYFAHTSKTHPCPNCNEPVWASKNKKFCSRACANVGRVGQIYDKTGTKRACTLHDRNMAILRSYFDFETCMVEDCPYATTFDVHRFEPGAGGGKYQIGNMFAICPNHHAEVTRKLTRLEKLNDYTLRAHPIT
jgi:hypothetical protein